MAETPAVRSTIVQLLSHMRDGKEIREYLNRFSRVDQSRFAVVKVGGAVIRDDLEGLAAALAFLQSVGLLPIVVHGGGPQLDTALSEAGIVSEKINGLRVTPDAAIPVIRDNLTKINLSLVEAIRRAGGQAAAIPQGVFEAEMLDQKTYGRVGEPTNVRLDLVDSALKGGEAPILACLGDTADGHLVNINADFAVRALVHKLQPYKIIFLTETGGLLDAKGQLISSVNLATEFDRLMASDWVSGGMRVKIEEIKRLLDDLPLTSSVSITRPEELAKELFTHAGAGTLVRKGEQVIPVSDKRELDPARTVALVEKSFGRATVPGYWDQLDLKRGFVTENYRAGALVTEVGGVAYLDKFAVLEEARGEGLSKTVWSKLVEAVPYFYWRSRAANPINSFYFSECHGAVRQGEWVVFWRGEEDLSRVPHFAEMIGKLPPTLAAP